ncbi:MAG: M23 family metallopeptidase [Chloroflexota bacterium]|nr:M23 family metallopeptidase [Chloroflexota bacterium]
MRLRILLVALFVTVSLTLFSLASAQDATPPPPPDTSGMDAVVGTPAPLPTMAARPAPSQTLAGARAAAALYFNAIPQGTVGLVGVAGATVTAASATWLDTIIDFFAVEGEGYFGILAAGMEQNPRRDYPLTITVTHNDGSSETLSGTVEITTGGFIRQEVTIPPERGYLLDAESERAELARLEGIFAQVTTERGWDSTGFMMPIPAALTSPFGAFRVFNATLNTRHTGWDIRCTTGTPVFASATGRVVFAGNLPIRGNHVIIDHGYGVFSGYSHLSVVNVTRGQSVTKEQVIGMTGATGRVSGAHFHWEMAVNGQWVDSVQFIEMWQP